MRGSRSFVEAGRRSYFGSYDKLTAASRTFAQRINAVKNHFKSTQYESILI